MRAKGAWAALRIGARRCSARCATIHNDPINVPMAGAVAATPLGAEVPASEDDILVSLAFSGGGTRAAAFSFGVLTEIDNTRIRDRGKSVSLLDRVDFVSGVSGGSVTAAYYGLKKRAALDRFPRAFPAAQRRGIAQHIGLARSTSAARSAAASTTPRISRAGSTTTCSAVRPSANSATDRRPRIWINASDIYNRTPFVFGKTAFDAMCSDLAPYPISEAVAASAAVPVVFAPVVIETYPDSCQTAAAGLDRARPQQSRRRADAARLRQGDRAATTTGSMRYVKLLDGGLVDNYGLSGFTIARLSATRPTGR